jgi:hypothetical protein
LWSGTALATDISTSSLAGSDDENHSRQAEQRQADSANDEDTVKSWTVKKVDAPGKQFLDSLDWQDRAVGAYEIRTGIIFNRWVAAVQFVLKGQLVLTEITPPYEYVSFVDLKTGKESNEVAAIDANYDGVTEIALVHRKLDDPKYHMYAVYSLTSSEPKLLWKSGGKLGDWLTEVQKGHSSERWHGVTSNWQ